ncbi:hypothetical protein ROV80_05280 [Stenotrophomonas pavanii]|uniref:hypothetical protein n=1 Tax=Stenotrophomonas pavanii TaxID=487698 RepID=UPI00289578CE|nr:hypothetical protein [Stenotrophomonas pavanii]MDT3454655.1 hypothetical protein [Stenotrophomonas pavanii]
MDAIEKRTRELLAVEYEKFDLPGTAAVVRNGGYDLNPSMRALVAALTPPEEPDQALLVSMAMLVYHGFGLLTPEQKQCQLREMRKLWDEVVGRGYYSPDNRERYVAMLAARPEVP